jgi:hypothetical protein
MTDLLPGVDEEFQDDGFVVDFSSEEASAESTILEPIPSGAYFAIISDVEVKECGSESNNPGKPYLRFTFTITEGKFKSRKVYNVNAMCFSPALYTVTRMMKALNLDVTPGKMKIPGPSFWLNKEMVIEGTRKQGNFRNGKDGERYPDKYEPSSFWNVQSERAQAIKAALKTSGGTVTAQGGSLLP